MTYGLLGTGLMGLPLAQRLLATGQPVTVWNRDGSRMQPLVAAGAQQAESPAAAIAASDILVLMLADASAIEATLLTPEARAALPGRLVVQMGTIAPDQSRAIAAQVIEAGGRYLEAPVLGSIPEARSGTLLVMAGGSEADFESALPVLQQFGQEPRLIGPVGQAMALKLALNQLIGSLTTGFSASLGLVQREGVPVEAFMEILRASALYAPTFDKKLQRMLDRDFERPNFPTRHLLKDMRLFDGAARAQGLDTALGEAIETVLERAIACGLADLDYSALYEAVDPPR
jgi:3-hydroxyisobutyrate dehydrogenase-like beta-hydroxyacid dehydrogenase